MLYASSNLMFKDVSYPYCTARFVPNQERNICTVCNLAVIGADASGLLCSPSQSTVTNSYLYVEKFLRSSGINGRS